MSYYWAKFEIIEDNLFRFDTRIYLNETAQIKDDHRCIGAIVGKNPGSARPSSNTSEFQPIMLDNDKLLPTVRSIINKSHIKTNLTPHKNAFIQVLNLFYLCEKDLDKAIDTIQNIEKPKICNSEINSFPWVWFVWGDQNNRLDDFKKRFYNLKTKNCFFYDQKAKAVSLNAPQNKSFAKHTQGLQHNLIVPYIATILEA